MAMVDGQMDEALEALKGLVALDTPSDLALALRLRREAQALAEHLAAPGFRLAMVGESDSLGDAAGQDLLSLLAGTGTAEVHTLVDEARSLGSFDGWCLVVPAGQLGNPLEQAFVRSIPGPLLPALALFITRHASLDASQRAMFREYAQLIFGPMGLTASQIAFFPSDEALDVLVGQQGTWEELRQTARGHALETLVRAAREDLDAARTELRERLWSLSSAPSPATPTEANEALENPALATDLATAPDATAQLAGPGQQAPAAMPTPAAPVDLQAVADGLASLLRAEGEALAEDLALECVERHIHPLLARAPAGEDVQEALGKAIEALNAWLEQAVGARLDEHFELLLALCARQPAASALSPDIWGKLSEQRPWEPQGERLCFVAPAPSWATDVGGEALLEDAHVSEASAQHDDQGASEDRGIAQECAPAPGEEGDGGGPEPAFPETGLVRHTPDWIWGARVAAPVAGALVGSWLGPRLNVRASAGVVLGALAGAVGMELVLRASRLTVGAPSALEALAQMDGAGQAARMSGEQADVPVNAAPPGAREPGTPAEGTENEGERYAQALAPVAAEPAREAVADWAAYAEELALWLSEEAGTWVREEVRAALGRTEEALCAAVIPHAPLPPLPLTPEPDQADAETPAASPGAPAPTGDALPETPVRNPEPSPESHRIAAGLQYIARAMEYVEALEEVLAGSMGTHFA